MLKTRLTNPKIKYIRFFSGVLGVYLLLISIYGEIINPYLENPQYSWMKNFSYETYSELDKRFLKKGLSESFLQDLMDFSNSNAVYSNDINKFIIKKEDNWILYLIGKFDPTLSYFLTGKNNQYLFFAPELPYYKKIYKRGFGVCSQLSIGIVGLLSERYGVDARVTGLDGHVVVQIFGGDGVKFIFDPAFGVYGRGDVLQPNDIPANILKPLALLRPNAYSANLAYVGKKSGSIEYSKKSRFKQLILFNLIGITYYLKWLMPLAMILYCLGYKNILRKKCVD